MSLLNITNLTDNPESMIKDKFLEAFEKYEKETKKTIELREKMDFIDEEINQLEEEMEEAKGKYLLSIIDNYLVNLDYYSRVKNWYDNK